ncbi:hypothetical protein [Spiroplasma sp. SV19]|uniref:hypothetical protein n=1 Tax=Spiroplasma sp. SV19 TaxID=2570468 RepID=UPI0024B78B4B|nr:hypothetical protein [Spiroplasma sp. SV19]WHQ37068.1 hypothetical protein E7Y35_04120 [Spiroplasma sp. SV19]
MNFNLVKEKIESAVNNTLSRLQEENLVNKVLHNDSDVSLRDLVHEVCDTDFIRYDEQDVLSAYYEENDRDRSANENFSEAYGKYILEVENKLIEKVNEITGNNVETTDDFERE